MIACWRVAGLRQLPADAPVPRLLGACDDGEWVALVLEEIPGNLPVQPWRREELDRVLADGVRAARTECEAVAFPPTATDGARWRRVPA
jgi:hypothetical protein